MRNLKFGDALKALEEGRCVARKNWNGKGMFVCKQVPCEIGPEIIPNMQSLPKSAKNLLLSRETPVIKYSNQMLLIQADGRADSWVPSSSDLFSEDWIILN